ncbi:hypothetical protein B7494_g5664 [Chlorociboria aeruginascens]|nr:hypothetical protein B7494_g5664 [Chlorociboria aeruginascens]
MTNAFNVEEVLSQLNTVEKVSLLSGIDWWHTQAIPKHKIPSIRVSDGPNGVRGTKFFNGTPAACFPCGTALGATFDVPLLKLAGNLMASESRSKGSHVILGPTINMQRSPLGGRGFESLSEDPILAGKGAAALVRGIEEKGIVATIKHFVCNDQEHERNGVDVRITERALREIYLLPFQIVIKEGKPGAVMTAYNKVNGTHVSENRRLIQGVLRGEWGWEGCVMSDWWGTYSTSASINAGLDLEMPGSTKYRGELLTHAVVVHKVPPHVLDSRARNVLTLINRCSVSQIPENAPETAENIPSTAAFLRKIGAESIVLLKNEGDILPLRKDKKTLIVGPNAKVATYHGGGSASLAAFYAITPYDGISAQLTQKPEYTVGCYAHKELPLLDNLLFTPSGQPGVLFRAYNEPPSVANREIADEILLKKTELLMMDYTCARLKTPLWYATILGSFTAQETCEFEFGLGVYGTAKLYINDKLIVDNETEQRKGTMFFSCGTVEEKGKVQLERGKRYEVRAEFGSAVTCKLDRGGDVLSGGGAVRIGGTKIIDAEEEVERAVKLAGESDWEGEGTDRETMELPGHMNTLISRVTLAQPNTVVVLQSGTPVYMPFLSSTPALLQAWYGGNETGNAIADIIFGAVNPSAKLPLSFPQRLEDNPAFLNYRSERGRTLYGEDVYVGYRWYEKLGLPVLFPFGHGLSYTSFSFSNLEVRLEGEEVLVSVTVKNTGKVKGKEVVQVYISQKTPSIRRPKKELQGFEKVELMPGEQKTVNLDLELKYAAAFWDEVREAWIVEKGEFGVFVGGSSEEKEGFLRGKFEVEKTFWWSGL